MISSRSLIKESGKRTYRGTKSKNKQVLAGPGLTTPFVKMKTSHLVHQGNLEKVKLYRLSLSAWPTEMETRGALQTEGKIAIVQTASKLTKASSSCCSDNFIQHVEDFKHGEVELKLIEEQQWEEYAKCISLS